MSNVYRLDTNSRRRLSRGQPIPFAIEVWQSLGPDPDMIALAEDDPAAFFADLTLRVMDAEAAWQGRDTVRASRLDGGLAILSESVADLL